MATKSIKTRIQSKHAYEYHWKQATNFIPLAGEIIIYDADINAAGDAKGTHTVPRIKIGDGITLVNNLPFTDAGITSGTTDPNTNTEGQYYFKYSE